MSYVICLTSSPYFSHFVYYLLNFLPWSLFRNTYYLMSLVHQNSHFPIFSFWKFLWLCLPTFYWILYFLFKFNFKELSFCSLYFMGLRSLKIWVTISVFFFLSPPNDSEILFSLSFCPLVCQFFGLHLSWRRHSPVVWWSLVAPCCWKLSWWKAPATWKGFVDWSAFLKGDKVTNLI